MNQIVGIDGKYFESLWFAGSVVIGFFFAFILTREKTPPQLRGLGRKVREN